MQNIQITHTKGKRSVESLIEDSAIDNEPSIINFEILELKKAYNETYKSFSSRVQSLETEIATYKEKCKKLEEANVSLAQKCYQFEKKKDQYNQMKIVCEKMKRKVLYIESKYEKLMENRSLVQQGYEDENKAVQKQNHEKIVEGNADSEDQEKYKVQKNQVYKEISDLIAAKVKNFTKEIRVYSMTKDLEKKIQAFLQELIYITPISRIQTIRVKEIEQKSSAKKGKREQQNIFLSDQKGWKQISRRIDQYQDTSSQKQLTPFKKQNHFNQEFSKKLNVKYRSPLKPSNNEDFKQSRQSQFRLSPSKRNIFPYE